MTKTTDIYFRTDGNDQIATGHIMRCLAVARACMQESGTQKPPRRIFFVVSDLQSQSLLQERFEQPEEFGVICLHSDYQRMEEEVPGLLSHITAARQANEKPWLFIDSYSATPAYFQKLSPYCRLAYLDDLRCFDCAVDLLINYDTDCDCPYYVGAARRLLGVQYAPLRAQFQTPAYDFRQEASQVFLSTGGTDPYGIAEYLLRSIYDENLISGKHAGISSASSASYDRTVLQSLHYHIIAGRANPRRSVLLALAGGNPHIHIHENVFNMAALMASCDLAVSAGGTTLFELCAAGVPSVSYLMADNQRTAIDTFSSKDIIPCAGEIRGPLSFTHNLAVDVKPAGNTEPTGGGSENPENTTITRILRFLSQMAVQNDLRNKSSQAMRAFIDGCGARRIAEALL